MSPFIWFDHRGIPTQNPLKMWSILKTSSSPLPINIIMTFQWRLFFKKCLYPKKDNRGITKGKCRHTLRRQNVKNDCDSAKQRKFFKKSNESLQLSHPLVCWATRDQLAPGLPEGVATCRYPREAATMRCWDGLKHIFKWVSSPPMPSTNLHPRWIPSETTADLSSEM